MDLSQRITAFRRKMRKQIFFFFFLPNPTMDTFFASGISLYCKFTCTSREESLCSQEKFHKVVSAVSLVFNICFPESVLIFFSNYTKTFLCSK